MQFSPEALSSFLTFRYLVTPEMRWCSALDAPDWPDLSQESQVPVRTATEILEFFEEEMAGVTETTGILLSGGIDSAILASYLPAGAKAYTIRFVAPGAIDETRAARQYAERLELDWNVVEVEWSDYLADAVPLMLQKRSPSHAIEVALLKAARVAAADGVETLLVGNGADSTFGGMDKLISRDWTFDEFVDRYTFVDPSRAQAEPVSMESVWRAWEREGGFDVLGFLKQVHGIGIEQSFEAGLHTGGEAIWAPYEKLRLDAPLDIERIRRGDTKYLLRDVFTRRLPGLEIPEKIPFARPMNVWMKDWAGPARGEFRSDLDMADFTGEQRWLLWCAEAFMDAVEAGQ